MAVSVVSFSFSMVAQPDPGVNFSVCWLSLLHAFTSVFHCTACPPSRLSPLARWTQLTGTQLVGLILPSNSHALIWTRLHDYFRYLGTGMCHFSFLWNGLCDRHRAEITVIQFRGHFLPVRQSMRVYRIFFTSSHFISQFPPTRFPLITATRMCHLLPVHYLEWHFWPGQQVKT